MMRIVKKFRKLLSSSQIGHIILIFIMMLVGAFFEVVSVSLMVPLVSVMIDPDIINTNKFAVFICKCLNIQTHAVFVLVCISALIAIYVVKNLFLILEISIRYQFIYRNRLATQRRILRAYMNRPYEYFLGINSGEVVRVVTSDVVNTYNLLITLLSFAAESIVSLALLITVFIISPSITVAVALAMILTLLVIAKFIKPRLKKAGKVRQKHASLTNKWLLQSINGIKEIKISQTKNYFQENYDKNGQKTIEAEKKNAVFGAIPRMLIEMVSISSALLIIAVLIVRGTEVETLIPALSAFAMAAVKLLPSVNRIASAMNAIAFQEPALDKLLSTVENIEDENEVVQDENNNTHQDIRLNDKIELKDITYSYPDTNAAVFNQANMSISIGQSVGIVGASGAGKTTIVDILLGLLIPQEGQVLADGIDVMQNYSEWLRHIGYIPQMIFMLDDTIRSNITFGNKIQDSEDSAVWRALEEAQLADFVRSLPNGLDTVIGERGVRLSGGQRQRIGIARALYCNPDILVFDEATSALDNETEEAIMESINSLRGAKTMIIIAHRLTTIKECDVVYRVEEGKIIKE